MTTDTLEPEVLTPAIIPTAELEKINATDVALAQLRAKAEELATVGVPHKAAYEEIHALTMVAVKVRTKAMEIAEEWAAPHKLKYDSIMSEGKRIGAHAKESESLLRPLKLQYEAEQVRIKEEAARVEVARIAARIDSLYKLGATFDGLTYNVFGVLIDAVEVKALPDPEWLELYDSANSAYMADLVRLANLELERQAEAARLEQQRVEQADERERLQAIADQQEQQRRELQAKQDAFEQEKRDAEAQRICEAQRVEVERLMEQRRIEKEQKAAQDAIDEAERVAAKKQTAEFLKKENKERSKRLAPDKKLMVALANAIEAVGFPVLANEESNELMSRFGLRLSDAVQYLRNGLDKF